MEGKGAADLKLKQALATSLKFALSAGLLWFLFKKGHLDFSLFGQLMTPSVLALGLTLSGATLVLQAWRWQMLLNARGFSVNFIEANKLFLIGTFFNYALPGAVGGDVVKAYYVIQGHPKRRLEAALTVLLDRILGLYALVAIALIAIVVDGDVVSRDPRLQTLALATFGVFAVMTLMAMAAFSKRIKRWLHADTWLLRLPLGASLLRAYQASQAYGDHKDTLVKAFLLGMVGQTLSILFMMVVGHAVGETSIPVSTYFFAVPLGFIASSIPIAPAGIGVGQVAFLMLFQLHSGRQSLLGQTAITAFQLAILVWGLLGAFFYLQRKRPASFAEESVEA